MSTNKDNELFELCKEVYKRTGLKQFAWLGEYPALPIEGTRAWYDSDYLLEKLPNKIDNRLLTLQRLHEVWDASYDDIDEIQDSHFDSFGTTPLKALLKLIITLDDAGVKLNEPV